jgi:P27 family predicted phage terminase small subunit
MMIADPLEAAMFRAGRQTPVRLELGRRAAPPRPAAVSLPPSFLVDDIAREEWDRVAEAVLTDGNASSVQRSLLAGYCVAVARAVRAEQTLAAEGRYYETRTKRGSVMRRRHPAAHDAEQGWSSARRLAKELGLTGGTVSERRTTEPRRSLFK